MKTEKKVNNVSAVRFTKDHLIIEMNKKVFHFEIKKISSRLARASMKKRRIFTVDRYGYGIHWPEIDEDLSISNLMKE